jgi:hypothetical protein
MEILRSIFRLLKMWTEKTMIKGQEPFEHKPEPSQIPLLRSQWMLELVLMLMPFAATNQLNYIVAKWGQLVVPYIWSQPARMSSCQLNISKPIFVYRILTNKYQRNCIHNYALQVILFLDILKKFTKLFSSSFKGPMPSAMVKFQAPKGKSTGLNLGGKTL